MPGVTKEQIAQAKEWDLLSYLQTYEPHELKRCGPHEYCTKTHDSLKISNGKWCWNSRGIGGRTAYLIKVRGKAYFMRAAAIITACLSAGTQRAAPGLPACGGHGTTFGLMWRAATNGITFPCWALTRIAPGWPWRKAPLTHSLWPRW